MRIRIKDNQSLEELNITLQMILAYLQDSNVAGASRVNIYLTPLRHDGGEKSLSPVEFERFVTLNDSPKAKSKGQGGGYRNTHKR